MKDYKATIYDLKGYLLPGLLALWSMVEALSAAGYRIFPEVQSFSFPVKATIAVAAAYVTGHALHAVCNYTIDRIAYCCYHSSKYFDERFKEDFEVNTVDALVLSIDSRFGISLSAQSSETEKRDFIKQQYWSVFQWAMKTGVTDVENFLGLTGFYRGITMAVFASSVAYLISFVWRFNLQSLSFSIVLLGVSALFLTRVRRFNCYLAKSVLGNFIVK